MLKMTLSLFLSMFSLIMFFINNPMMMGLFILMQTLIISIFIGMFMNTYWFSYILFLVFMGGMLVLFIYISSIASNEIVNMSINMKMSFLMIISVSLIIAFLNYSNINLMNMFKFNEMFNSMHFIYFFNENNINLSKLYNKQNYFLTMMLILYLFITLIAVIKITNIFYGPLRSFN